MLAFWDDNLALWPLHSYQTYTSNRSVKYDYVPTCVLLLKVRFKKVYNEERFACFINVWSSDDTLIYSVYFNLEILSYVGLYCTIIATATKTWHIFKK